MGRHASWPTNLAGFQGKFFAIRKKATAADHGCGDSENHEQETESQVMTTNILQSLVCASREDKEAMTNITSINLTLYQSLTKSQETILVTSEQLQDLQAQSKEKKPKTKKPSMDKNERKKYQRATARLMG